MSSYQIYSMPSSSKLWLEFPDAFATRLPMEIADLCQHGLEQCSAVWWQPVFELFQELRGHGLAVHRCLEGHKLVDFLQEFVRDLIDARGVGCSSWIVLVFTVILANVQHDVVPSTHLGEEIAGCRKGCRKAWRCGAGWRCGPAARRWQRQVVHVAGFVTLEVLLLLAESSLMDRIEYGTILIETKYIKDSYYTLSPPPEWHNKQTGAACKRVWHELALRL